VDEEGRQADEDEIAHQVQNIVSKHPGDRRFDQAED
jgi:hypothetical protein